jgi:hypothetical protein
VVEKRRYNDLVQNNQFEEKMVQEYIKPYIDTLHRNEEDLQARLLELTGIYVERFEGATDLGSADDRIQAVADYFEEGCSKDNPKAHEFFVHPQMKGKLDSEIQSYHIIDNPKYQNVKQILDTINEAYKAKIRKEGEENPEIEGTVG